MPIEQFMLEVVRYSKQEKPIKESKVSVTFCPDGLTTPKKFRLRLWLNKTKMTIMMSTLIRKPNLQKVWQFFILQNIFFKGGFISEHTTVTCLIKGLGPINRQDPINGQGWTFLKKSIKWAGLYILHKN